MSSIFIKSLESHLKLFNNLDCLESQVDLACLEIVNSINDGGKVMFCGNGGSAADSQHLAAEFIGRYTKDRPPLSAIALTTDSSALTCIANDYSFDVVFSRQVEGLGNAGDCLVALSTSGNSKNVIEAVIKAKDHGIKTIGMLGNKGGRLSELCDVAIIVPSDVTASIQEAHIMIGHVICGQVEINLGLV